jgi:type II secretory pathway pseudopilin PulG
MRRAEPSLFHRLPRPTGGFTQIEVLTAMLVIGIATPFLMGAIIGGLTQARHSQDRGVATAWAQGEIDWLRLRCYGRLTPSSRKVTPSTIEAGELPPPPGFAAGYVQLDAAGPALLKVTVSLYRQGWNGAAPTRLPYATASTYIGDTRTAGLCP